MSVSYTHLFPPELVEVLTTREIAAQETQTFESQKVAEQARIALENQRGVADAQAELARANVSVEIKDAEAKAAVKQAEGEASVTRQRGTAAADVTKLTGEAEATAIQATGLAEAEATKAKGLAVAAGFEAQQDAIGADQTALVAALEQIGKGGVVLTPQIQVGGDSVGTNLLSTLMTMGVDRMVNGKDSGQPELEPETTPSEADSSAEPGDEALPSDDR